MSIEARVHQGIGIIQVTGDLTRDNQARLSAASAELEAQEIHGIALDLTQLDYIDSAGLGACAGLHKRLRSAEKHGLCVYGASPSITRMWQIIRLDLVIPLHETEADALEYFARKCAEVQEESRA